MQSHYIPQQYVYETLSVPVELVPVVKSLIDSHNSKLISMILPTSQGDYHRVPPLPPLPPPPPLLPSPLPLQSHALPTTQAQSLHSSMRRKYNHRVDYRNSNHTICIDWLKNDCKNKSCILHHQVYARYKTEICDHWKNNRCRYDEINCKYVHGYSDLLSRIPKEDNKQLYFIDKRGTDPRGRSRSREKY
jgi:hypothetical protein